MSIQIPPPLPSPTIDSVPPIYAPRLPGGGVSISGRLIGATIGIACLSVLLLAAKLTPNPAGVGTHEKIGLQSCQFLDRTGIPCPSCGMTTSFTWFAHGNIAASFYVQPMGTILAILCAIGVWAGLYIAISGRAVHRLLRGFNAMPWVVALLTFAVAAWGWKVWIHTHGIDGWN